jgi:transglutaminase-like putative cysteine protease
MKRLGMMLAATGLFACVHSVVCFGVLLLAAAAPHAAFGQFQAPSEEELKMTSDPDAPGAAAVYLYREQTEDDPHHFRTVYARIKVLTEQGKDLATVHVNYPRSFVFNPAGNNTNRSSSAMQNYFDMPDVNHFGENTRLDPDNIFAHVEVSAIQGRTIHPDGTVIPLTGASADLLKVKRGADQFNEITFNLPSVEVGSVLEYRYQVRYDFRFQQAPLWQVQQPYFVHKARYIFIPTDQFLPNHASSAGVDSNAIVGLDGQVLTDIKLARVLPPGKEVNKDALGRYFVDFTDIPPIPQEAYAPPLEAQIYKVDFYYTSTADAKEFWQKEMQGWIKAVDKYIAPTATIKSTAAEVASGFDNPLDKAKQLYELVQRLNNTDIAGGSPSIVTDEVPQGSVEKVLERKSGNGEQIALLYLSLARAAGLNARPVRIASRNRSIFDSEFLNTDQLDAVVIGVTINGKEIVLDPGVKMAPFQTLYWPRAGAGGVAMAANSKVETIVTPLQDNQDNTVVRVGSLNISPQGTVSGTLKVGFVGQQALQLRQMALRTDSDSVKRTLEGMIVAQLPDGVEAHIDYLSGLDDPNKQLVAVVPVTGSIGNRTGSHLILPRLFFDSKETDPFPAETSRSLPVDLHYPAQEQEQVTYVFPAGFALEETPEDASMRWGENAAYQLRSKASANSITSARILARGFTLLDPSEYGRLRDFYDKVAHADRQQIALTGPAAAAK